MNGYVCRICARVYRNGRSISTLATGQAITIKQNSIVLHWGGHDSATLG